MNVNVVNLGCKVNRVESDTIALSYQGKGDRLTSLEEADVVVVNTCTVTEEADKKTRKTIRRVLRTNPCAKVLVTGCAVSIDPAFFDQLDERVCVVDKIDLLDEGESALASKADALVRVGDYFPTRVSMKVQDGCNHSCTYCIVHVARGKAWSKPAGEVFREAVDLADAGAKELVFTGIDLGSYCCGAGTSRIRLGKLVRQTLSALDDSGHRDVRLRIGSIEPCSLDSEFVQVMADSDGRVCRHLHLPLQSGSSKVLEQMNRPYSAERFLQIIEDLKRRVPGISLTTDMIVGFPGESDQDFEQSLILAKEVGFSKIHVFRYSRRKGTPAAERNDQIPPQLKESRSHRLGALGDDLRLSFAKNQVGSIERVAVEQEGIGMSESYFRVRVPDSLLPGSLVERKLAGLDEGSLTFFS